MKFTTDTLKKVLTTIEEKLTFCADSYNEAQGLDFHYFISIDDIINSIGVNQSEDIRYCLAILRQIGYVEISNGKISKIIPNGYKFICDVLHGINFKY